MATIDGSTSGKSLMLVDVNGPAPGQDDLIVGRGLNVALFRNVATPNYLTLPQLPVVRTGFMSGTPSFAGGDFSGDGRADLVAVNTQSMRRFIGSATGDGTFSGMTTVTTTPGPGGGIPVIFGRTVAVANTRLRLYDQRCTSAPSGFPVNETFVAGGLCASVALPGTAGARSIVTPPSEHGSSS